MKNGQMNLNDYVTVHLTEHGVNILRERHEKFRKAFNSDATMFNYSEFVPPENNILTIQMWELMQVFGEHFGPWRKQPFELWISLHKVNCKEVESK